MMMHTGRRSWEYGVGFSFGRCVCVEMMGKRMDLYDTRITCELLMNYKKDLN